MHAGYIQCITYIRYQISPTLGKGIPYNNLEKKVKIWEDFTFLPEEKKSLPCYDPNRGSQRGCIKCGN